MGAKDVLNTSVHVNRGVFGSIVRGTNPVGASGGVLVRIPPPNVGPNNEVPFVITADHHRQVFEVTETDNSRRGICITQATASATEGS